MLDDEEPIMLESIEEEDMQIDEGIFAAVQVRAQVKWRWWDISCYYFQLNYLRKLIQILSALLL